MQGASTDRQGNDGSMSAMLYVLILCLTVMWIYTIVMESLGVETHSSGESTLISIVKHARVDSTYFNLILSEDGEEIDHIIIEIFSSADCNLGYITIPTDTKVVVMGELRRKIKMNYNKVPEQLEFSDIHTYFKKQDVYQYASLMAEQIVGSEISFYTIMESGTFHKYYMESKTNSQSENEVDKDRTIFVCSEDMLKKLYALDKENSKVFLREVYHDSVSNLSYYNRLKYAPYFSGIHPENIRYWSIIGNSGKKGFFPDLEENSLLSSAIRSGWAFQDHESKEELKTEVGSDSAVEGAGNYYSAVLSQTKKPADW